MSYGNYRLQISDQLTGSMVRLLDSFLPEGDYETFLGINRRRKSRLIIAISGLGGLSCLIITLISRIVVGAFDITDPITIVIGILLLSNPFIMRTTGRAEISARLFPYSTFAASSAGKSGNSSR